MNLTNEISFDEMPTQGQEAKINYNGYLAQNGAQDVTLIYGYNSDWRDTDAILMNKVGNGYETVLKIKPYDELNFCFRDEKFNWDNNYGNNFSAQIQKAEARVQEQSIAEELAQDAEVNLDANIELADVAKIEQEISELFDRLFKADVKEEVNVQTAATIDVDSIVTPAFEPDAKEDAKAQEFNLDELIDEILTPILSQPAPVYVPVDEVRINDVKNITELESVNDFVEVILNNEYSQNAIEEAAADNTIGLELDDYDNLISNLIENTELFENSDIQADIVEAIVNNEEAEEVNANVQEAETVEEVEVKPAKIAKKDFTVIEDDLEDELAEEPSLLESEVEDARNERVSANQSLVVTDEEDDLVAPRKLSSAYMFFKKIRLAIAKVWYNLFKSGNTQEN